MIRWLGFICLCASACGGATGPTDAPKPGQPVAEASAQVHEETSSAAPEAPAAATPEEINAAVESLLGDQPFMVHLADTDAYVFAERNELAEGMGEVTELVVESKEGERDSHEIEDAAAARTWLSEKLAGRTIARIPGTPWPDGGERLDLGAAGVVVFDGYGTLAFPGGVKLDLGNDEFGVRPDKVFAAGHVVGILVRELSPANQQVSMYLLRSASAK